jgi:hypothetical protein
LVIPPFIKQALVVKIADASNQRKAKCETSSSVSSFIWAISTVFPQILQRSQQQILYAQLSFRTSRPYFIALFLFSQEV